MQLAENTGRKQIATNLPFVQHCTTLSGYIFAAKACINNQKKNTLNINTSSTCPYNMVNFSPLMAEIGLVVWGTQENSNRFHVLMSSLHRRRSPEVNQTLHDVWPSPGLVHYIHFRGLLLPDGILIGKKFTFHPSLAFSCIGSITAWHSSSGHQPNFATWYK